MSNAPTYTNPAEVVQHGFDSAAAMAPQLGQAIQDNSPLHPAMQAALEEIMHPSGRGLQMDPRERALRIRLAMAGHQVDVTGASPPSTPDSTPNGDANQVAPDIAPEQIDPAQQGYQDVPAQAQDAIPYPSPTDARVSPAAGGPMMSGPAIGGAGSALPPLTYRDLHAMQPILAQMALGQKLTAQSDRTDKTLGSREKIAAENNETKKGITSDNNAAKKDREVTGIGAKKDMQETSEKGKNARTQTVQDAEDARAKAANAVRLSIAAKAVQEKQAEFKTRIEQAITARDGVKARSLLANERVQTDTLRGQLTQVEKMMETASQNAAPEALATAKAQHASLVQQLKEHEASLKQYEAAVVNMK